MWDTNAFIIFISANLVLQRTRSILTFSCCINLPLCFTVCFLTSFMTVLISDSVFHFQMNSVITHSALQYLILESLAKFYITIPELNSVEFGVIFRSNIEFIYHTKISNRQTIQQTILDSFTESTNKSKNDLMYVSEVFYNCKISPR